MSKCEALSELSYLYIVGWSLLQAGYKLFPPVVVLDSSSQEQSSKHLG